MKTNEGSARSITAVSLGNALEWYDFAVYAAFAIAIGANFFPGESPGLVTASFTSVAPTVLAELFPTTVRVTGVSLVYNAAFTIFGGFAPAILSWLTATAGGSALAPAWYVTLAAVPALAALRMPTRTQPILEAPIQEG